MISHLALQIQQEAEPFNRWISLKRKLNDKTRAIVVRLFRNLIIVSFSGNQDLEKLLGIVT